MIFVTEGPQTYTVYTSNDQPPLGAVWKGCGGWAGRLNYTASHITATGRTRKEVVDRLLAADAQRNNGRTRKETIDALAARDAEQAARYSTESE